MAELENVEKKVIRKNKGSKKTKRSWRTKTDIEDVEEHLEDIRRQERTGGIVSEKSNEELFFIENEAKDPVNKKAKVKDAKEGSESSDEEEYVSRKDKMKMKVKQEIENERKKKAKMQKVPNDMWNSMKQNDTISNDKWVQSSIPIKPKKPNSVGEKILHVNAVDVCHPGASYNPDFDDHQKLLSNALEDEITSLQNKEKLNKKLKFLSREEFSKQPGWLEEMSEGIIANKKETLKDLVEEAASDEEVVLSKTVNAEDRKTNRIRRKEKERIEEERLKQDEKMKKLKLNDIYRLRSLKRELKGREAELQEKRRKKMELKLQKTLKPKRLGKLKYENPKLDFQLSEELSGSLRGLKNEGNPFKDRIKSLEKRNMIEPRKRVLPHRKYKEKFVEKRSYNKPTVKDVVSNF